MQGPYKHHSHSLARQVHVLADAGLSHVAPIGAISSSAEKRDDDRLRNRLIL